MQYSSKVNNEETWARNILSLQNVLSGTTEGFASSKASLENFLFFTNQVNKANGLLFFVFNKEKKEWEAKESIFKGDLNLEATKLNEEAKTHLSELERTSKSGIYQVESIPGFYKFVIVPVVRNKTVTNFICLLIEAVQKAQVVQTLITLQFATGYILYANTLKDQIKEKWGFQEASGLLEILHKSIEGENFLDSCQILANELQLYLNCSYVSIGKYKASKGKVLALSSTANFDKRNIQSKTIAACMEECIQAGSSFEVYPSFGEGENEARKQSENPQIKKHHIELQLLTHANRIVTLPLKDAFSNTPIGAILFIWKENQSLQEKDLNIIEAAAPYLESVFKTIQYVRKPFLKKIFEFFKTGLSKHEKYLVSVASVLLLILMVLPFDYKIKANASLEPVLRRQIEAPFKSTLKKALVNPGDVVKNGQLLAILEEKDLESELAELNAAREQAIKESSQALAQNNPSQARISQLETEQLSAKIAILTEQKNKLNIFSPIEGILIEGDLKRFEGSPLNLGDKLFEIAPLDKMIVEASIPEEEIRYIQLGKSIELKLDSFPEKNWYSVVKTVKPNAQIKDGKNVFIAEAELTDFKVYLRPGMKGKAKILTTEKPLYWILFHRPWDYLRMLLFW